MTTKILEYDFPLNLNNIQKDMDEYINKGYVYMSNTYIPERSFGNSTYYPQLIIVLHKYSFDIYGGRSFNGGDI